MTLRLNGDSSGFTEIKAPNAAGDNSITLPANNGSARQLLQNTNTPGTLQYTSDLVYDSGKLLVGTESIGTDNFTIYSPLQVQSGVGAYALAIRNRAPQNDYAFISFGSAEGNEQLVNIYSGRTAENTGNLSFATNNGNADTTKRIEIASDGTLKLINSPGIDFSGIQAAPGANTTSASETFNAYEKGSWTPTLPAGGTYGLQSASYVRIGCKVFVYFYMTSVSVAGNTSEFNIGGLPFDVKNDQYYPVGQIGYTHQAVWDMWRPLAKDNSDVIYFHRVDGISDTANNNDASTLTHLLLSVCYETDA